jgi:thiol-disulfide isomerase/thioredoxin
VIGSSPGGARPATARDVTLSVAVLIAALACGYGYYRFSKPHHPSLYATPPAVVTPTAAVAPDAAPVARTIPERIPDLTLVGLDGASHRLSEWGGHQLLINFWATWCEPCRREIPLLKSLRSEHASKRLEIVGIAIDYHDPVRKYVADNRMSYPVLLGERGGFEAAAAFGMDTVLPFSVFADAQGRIVALKVGELHRDEAELILDRMGKLDSGSLTLQAARDEISDAITPRAPVPPASGPAAAQ